ncbi:putative 2-aminoethylphosphonate ABC transporter substrate-binding protein [Solimonas sp. K1W22B-7]|uniref:putative 2-aminoethylphosphonate ABC transporter substrate-binding protein n=1 Tax=Solimonas sp. K1W22B-7 TaxID=2303331 RepID=UPI000E331F90|nr:putative 2-aminoethylphosphonate ABC transporter substrate-binding protein [Solimonas sp. K1W22B-7]AXQ28918.1 putative 2-aminoethylphosphonate ABC transporter substrate-binding protein [Solimonas sp. K1W22B-7]
MKHCKHKIAALLALTLIAACGKKEQAAEPAAAAPAPAAKTELTVYTAFEPEQLPGFKQAFEAANPEITLSWVRDSTGVITARLLAEKDNPRADAVWGLAASSLMLLKAQGMLAPYAPQGVEKLDPRFVDSATPPQWTADDAWEAAICVNTVEAQKHKLPMPKSWADLAKPVYKGYIVMPNPNSSGTGFLAVSGWLQQMGEEPAWKYMDALHANVARYTHSGSKPCKEAAAGEIAIGISIGYTGAKQKAKGAPIEIVHAAEGVGWDMEANAIVAGTKKLEASKKLMDFAVSEAANQLYNEAYPVVALPGIAKPVEHYPANLADKLIKNDFAWAATNRERILAEWQKRYDGKSEPKS